MLKIRIAFIAFLSVLGLAVLGCENSNPITPTTVGELKSDDAVTASDAKSGVQLISYGEAELIPGAPSLLKEQEEVQEIESFKQVDKPGGNEIVRFEMVDGYHIPRGCDIILLANGKNIGTITTSKNLSYGNIRLEDGDLPDGRVTITMQIACNGETAATAEVTIDRPDGSSNVLLIDNDDEDDEEDEDEEVLIQIDDVYMGDNPKHAILEFENRINATSSVKKNVTVEDEDGRDYDVVDYDESDRLVTLILRKDLPAGKEITVSYNGRGGLKGRSGGEKVEEFEFEFTTPEEEVLNIREAIAIQASTIVPNGLYRAGTTLIIAMEHFGYKVSALSRQILSNFAFPVERDEGETEVVFIRSTDLGLQPGKYTGSDVIAAVTAAGYSLLPPETAPQSRLLYPDQPSPEVVLFISIPVPNPTDGKNYLFFLGREDHVAPGKWLTAIPVSGTINYSLLAVGKKR